MNSDYAGAKWYSHGDNIIIVDEAQRITEIRLRDDGIYHCFREWIFDARFSQKQIAVNDGLLTSSTRTYLSADFGFVLDAQGDWVLIPESAASGRTRGMPSSVDSFAAKMAEVAGEGNPEIAHAAMDETMAQLLYDLGYCEGIDTFDAQEKWYA